MTQQRSFNTRILLVLLLYVASIPGVHAQPFQAKQGQMHAAAPTGCGNTLAVPNCDWVNAGILSGGCTTSGTCHSNTSAPISGLFEAWRDAERVGAENNASDRSQHGGYPTYVPRQRCWVQTNNGVRQLTWSAGIWHHGATWQRVNGRWYDTNHHWAFEHDDTCQALPSPTMTPTAAAPTSAVPAPVAPTVAAPTSAVPAPVADPPTASTSGAFTVRISQCDLSGAPMPATISAWSGDWNDQRYAATTTFAVPSLYRQVAYHVDAPRGWTAQGSASGTALVGSTVSVILWNTATCQTATPSPATAATPTTPPVSMCNVPLPDDGSHVPITVSGRAAAVVARHYRNGEGSIWNKPQSPPTQGQVAADVPLQLTFDFGMLNERNFGPDHEGQVNHIRFGIIDLTTGQLVLDADTEDIKELRNNDDSVVVWGRSLQLSRVVVNDVRFAGTGVWRSFNRIHSTPNQPVWGPPSATPRTNLFFHELGPVTATFTPQAGHRYEAWTMTHRFGTACAGTHTRWVWAMFGDASVPTPTPCAGPCPTPPDTRGTPTPVPTPTPPTPPQPRVSIGLLYHSRHDPREGGALPSDGVYAADAQLRWPQGEVIDFMPQVSLDALPLPSSDADWGQLYRFEQRVVGWSFVGSEGRATDKDGCRGAGKHGAVLPGCTYPYIPAPSEADMRHHAAHALWATGYLPPQDTDVFVYGLDRFRSVELTIAVAVTVDVVDVRSGRIVRSTTTTVEHDVTVDLIAPRTAR